MEQKEKEQIIEKTTEFVKETLAKSEGGHDWWHAYRVWKISKRIAASENADLFIVELGALLHDIADRKFHHGDEEVGPKMARDFLNSLGVEKSVAEQVEKIIANISFGCEKRDPNFKSKELAVVQDADRLDALGAIGIARTFNYGGHKGRKLFDPNIQPNTTMTCEEYKNNVSPTINHFYEKLLLLKDRMNTKTGREIAEHRHKFMEQFLEEFYGEWYGKL